MGWKDTITQKDPSWRDTITDEPEEKPWYDVSAEGLKKSFTPGGMVDSFERGTHSLDENVSAPIRKFDTELVTGDKMDHAPTGQEQAKMAMDKLGMSDMSYGDAYGVGGDLKPSDIYGTGLEVVQDPVTWAGGAIGKVGEMMGQGLGKVAPNLARKFEEISARQGARAMGLERGTAKKLGEDRVMDIGRQARDEKLFSPLSNTEDKISANQVLKNKAAGERNSAYNAIDQAGASQFNPLDTAANVETQLGGFNKTSPLNAPKVNQLENTLEAITQRGDKNIPMSEAQNLLYELKDAASWSGVGKKTPKEEMAQEAYMIVRDAVNQAAGKSSEMVGIDGLQDAIKSANRKYSIAKDTDMLLNNKFAREAGNKTFGLTDNVVGAGGIAGNFPSATVAAGIGAKKIGEKYGSQFMSIGFKKFADLVEKSPQSLGKYGKALKDASLRGGSALGVTDFMLQQTDPEYRKLKEQLEGENGP